MGGREEDRMRRTKGGREEGGGLGEGRGREVRAFWCMVEVEIRMRGKRKAGKSGRKARR